MPDQNYGDTVSALDTLRKQAVGAQLHRKSSTKVEEQADLEGKLARLQKSAGIAATHLSATEGKIQDMVQSGDYNDSDMHNLAAKAAALKNTLSYLKGVGQSMAESRPGKDFLASNSGTYPEAPVDKDAAAKLRVTNPAPPDPYVAASANDSPGSVAVRNLLLGPTPP